MVAEQVNQAGFWAGDIVNRRKDGTEYREALTITAVRDRDGKIIGRVGAARDITREREVEAQLAQASRMEAIGQLAGGVAHDFNNLLTAILGYGSMLADALEPDSPEAADLSEILGAARRAQSLTSQLLAFGRRTLLQPRIVDPAELVRRLAPMLERLIGEDVELSVAAHSGRSVRIDPGQLDQAVVNLVVNARDAMPAGGTVTVAVRPATSADLPSERAIPSSSPDDVAATVGTRPEDWVVVEVADSGVGMTDTVRARAFEPFFTTKPIGKGTGLGLAMVEGFMRQSGGFVAVTTAPGQGTRVALILPGADDRAAPARDEPGPSPGVAASRTVLVVEDEPAIRRLASRALRDAGHTVLEAGSGEAALAMAESHVGPIDVLFTDIVMPGMSGPTLAAELARRYPGLRVVLTSGYAESEVARRGVAVGANGFLRKPYSAGELRAALAASA
jgi:signal transduction histidine kinase